MSLSEHLASAPAGRPIPGDFHVSRLGGRMSDEHQISPSHLCSRIQGAELSAKHARKVAEEAVRETDRAEAAAWSIRMEGYGGPAQPSPTIARCLNGGVGWLEVKCNRCETKASIPLEHVRRPSDTPIWKLENSLRCRSCGTRKYRPPVHMIKLTTEREVTPYKWVHPDEDERH